MQTVTIFRHDGCNDVISMQLSRYDHFTVGISYNEYTADYPAHASYRWLTSNYEVVEREVTTPPPDFGKFDPPYTAEDLERIDNGEE